MDVSQLIALFRAEAKDQKKPYLWQDVELITYAGEAEYEAARRTRCLFDFSTPAICAVAVTANQPLYKLDPRVLFVRRLKLSLQPHILPKCDQRDLDTLYWGWEEMPASYPCTWFAPNFRHIRLVPAPNLDQVMNLQVVRLPLDRLTGLGDEPEIDERWHDGLVHWMLYRAYGKQDSQSNDPQKAATALAQYENVFGKISNARDEVGLAEKHGMDEYEGGY